MTADTLRIGLIGCGRIAQRHVGVISALPDVALAAVCDLREERARKVALPHTAVYVDFEAMLRKERLDLAVVLTESGSHERVARAASPHTKALLIEKPIALTPASADRIRETCDAHGTRVFVVKQNRYNRPVVRLRHALEAGRFGKLVMGTVRVRWCRDQGYYDQDAWRGTWRDDGGVFTNQASHHVDLLQWMMGPVESVKAFTATRLVNIETEDTGVAILRFTNGSLGVIEATTATRPKDLEGSISILGELGSVVIGGFAVNKIHTWEFSRPIPSDGDIHQWSENPPNVYGFGHLEFYRDLIDAIRTKRRAMTEGDEGRRSVELINAMYESALTGSEVRVRYVPRESRSESDDLRIGTQVSLGDDR